MASASPGTEDEAVGTEAKGGNRNRVTERRGGVSTEPPQIDRRATRAAEPKNPCGHEVEGRSPAERLSLAPGDEPGAIEDLPEALMIDGLPHEARGLELPDPALEPGHCGRRRRRCGRPLCEAEGCDQNGREPAHAPEYAHIPALSDNEWRAASQFATPKPGAIGVLPDASRATTCHRRGRRCEMTTASSVVDAPTRPLAEGGEKWEYVIVPLQEVKGMKKADDPWAPDQLNELGGEGWEAVGLYPLAAGALHRGRASPVSRLDRSSPGSSQAAAFHPRQGCATATAPPRVAGGVRRRPGLWRENDRARLPITRELSVHTDVPGWGCSICKPARTAASRREELRHADRF